MKSEITVFTVCNLAYLPKALILAESLFKHQGIKLKVIFFDQEIHYEFDTKFMDILWIEDFKIPNFKNLAFQYDIIELSTCLKAHLALQFLKKNKKVIFLDPDTCVYHSIDPILKELQKYPVIVTPHYITPQSKNLSDSDLGLMKFGSFNLGFFAVNHSRQAIDFLTWWSDRSIRFSFLETQFGLATDQKWVPLASCFFDFIHISRNLGYNVAFWNMHERTLQPNNKGGYLVNKKYPLIFFHFSSFDEERPENLSRRDYPDKNKNRKDVIEMGNSYKKALELNRKLFPQFKYSYNYMSNGNYITPTLRRAYACVQSEFPVGHDPFDAQGAVGSFAKKNKLFEKKNTEYLPSGYADISNHKSKFTMVYFFMRIILRLIGPNRFNNFSRLLVYLSSYRQNRGLWKL